MKFTTKKAREEWLRSDAAWTELSFCAPIRILRLNIPGHNIVRIQALHRRSEWVLELHRQMLQDAIYYANMQIWELDEQGAIIGYHNIKSLIDLMIAEGM